MVSGRENSNASVRNTGVRVGNRNSATYSRESQIQRGGSTYTRPSSTRVNSYQRSDAFNRLNNNGSSRQNINRNVNTNQNRSSYSTGSSSRNSFGGSSYRSSGGGTSRGSMSTGGGARRR